MSKNKNNIVRMQPQVENNNPPEEEVKDEEVPVNETPEAPVEKKLDWADKIYARHCEKRAEREAKAAEREAKRAEKSKPKKKIGKGLLIGGAVAAVVVGKAVLSAVLDAANKNSDQSVPQLEAGEPELVTLPEDTGESVNEAQET